MPLILHTQPMGCYWSNVKHVLPSGKVSVSQSEGSEFEARFYHVRVASIFAKISMLKGWDLLWALCLTVTN